MIERMMKKLLSFVVATMLATTVSAQMFKDAPAGALQKNAVKELVGKQKKSPANVMAAAKALIMGTYTSDEVADAGHGLGLPNYPGTLGVASEIPVEALKNFEGGKVVKIRVGQASAAEITRVFILPVLANGSIGDPIMEQNVKGNAAGWNEFEIENPVQLDFTNVVEILLGYDYTQTSNGYPLSMVEVGNLMNVLVYGNLGQGEGWYNLGNGYGNLSIQAYVESDNFPEKNIIIDGLMTPAFVSAEDGLSYQVSAHNFGTKDIEKFTLDFEIDGNKVGSYESTEALSTSVKAFQGKLTLPEGLSFDKHTLKVKVVTVDGVAPTENLEDDEAEATFFLYSKNDVVDRQKFLVEELTSHSCTYCPYGAGIVDKLLELYNDISVACIHGNQSQKDPWNTTECEALNTMLGLNSWPSGALNRIYSEEDGALTRGFGYYPEYAEQVAAMFYGIMKEESMPCFATVNVNAEVVDGKLNITVSGAGTEKVKTYLGNATLTVYVTEDGIVGRQLNLGKWVSDYEHNHVLRDLVTNVVGDDINWKDNSNYENVYSVSVGSDWKVENLKVIAFLAQKPTSATAPDFRNMAVYNANDVAVTNTDGIHCIENAMLSTAVKSYYTIDGRQVSQPQRGLNIVRMADGQTVKVLVK